MAGISSVDLYNFVVYVMANKSQDGAVTIGQYNQSYYAASLQLFEQYMGELEDYKPNYPIAPIAYSKTNKVESDMAPFRVSSLNISSSNSGVITLPSDAVYVTDLYKVGEAIIPYPATRINEQRLANQLASRVAPPTAEHPFYMVNNTSVSVFPAENFDFKITYIKKPEAKLVKYTLDGNGRALVTPVGFGGTDSQYLEWGYQNFNDLAVIILMLLGVNLKDGELIQYSRLRSQGQ